MTKEIIFDCFGVVRTDSFDDVYRLIGGDPDKDYAFMYEFKDFSVQDFAAKLPRPMKVELVRIDNA